MKIVQFRGGKYNPHRPSTAPKRIARWLTHQAIEGVAVQSLGSQFVRDYRGYGANRNRRLSLMIYTAQSTISPQTPPWQLKIDTTPLENPDKAVRTAIEALGYDLQRQDVNGVICPLVIVPLGVAA